MENTKLKEAEAKNLAIYQAKANKPKFLLIGSLIIFLLSLTNLDLLFSPVGGFSGFFAWSGLIWLYGVRVTYKRGIYNYNDYNSSNDGVYFHKFHDGKKRYEIEINTNNETVRLASGNNEKTYTFSQIEGVKSVCGSTSYNYFATASGGLSGSIQNIQNSQLAKATAREDMWRNNGLFIQVDDMQFPKWHIKFYAENFIKFNAQEAFWQDVEMQYERWLKVFEKTVHMQKS
ncbi:DUF4755 domain-containing protein [Lonepinella sp. BR2271]|uniref:DUF4755 domain-containing protein n=1 Tax=Lonepinella sp. BR2271 TaxID=3434550 RepID=UPI003F6DD98C